MLSRFCGRRWERVLGMGLRRCAAKGGMAEMVVACLGEEDSTRCRVCVEGAKSVEGVWIVNSE